MLTLNALLAAGLLAVALYAQQRIGLFTAGAGKAALTRAVLALVGVLLFRRGRWKTTRLAPDVEHVPADAASAPASSVPSMGEGP